VAHKIGMLDQLGLGYLRLGQSSTTLSGGEAQRVKLASELGKLKRGAHNLYILDEPTTGLHLADIQRLLDSLNRLVDAGHTVLVIEHQLDVIKTADHVIDLGPEGGAQGGNVLVCGTPEEVARCEMSHTGRFLRPYL
jgi:excinuclease ABC subunit A